MSGVGERKANESDFESKEQQIKVNWIGKQRLKT